MFWLIPILITIFGFFVVLILFFRKLDQDKYFISQNKSPDSTAADIVHAGFWTLTVIAVLCTITVSILEYNQSFNDDCKSCYETGIQEGIKQERLRLLNELQTK